MEKEASSVGDEHLVGTAPTITDHYYSRTVTVYRSVQ